MSCQSSDTDKDALSRGHCAVCSWKGKEGKSTITTTHLISTSHNISMLVHTPSHIISSTSQYCLPAYRNLCQGLLNMWTEINWSLIRRIRINVRYRMCDTLILCCNSIAHPRLLKMGQQMAYQLTGGVLWTDLNCHWDGGSNHEGGVVAW